MPPRRSYKRHEPSEEELAFRIALGQRIRTLRYPKYNQEEFADEIDVFRTHMSTIEQGKTDPRLSTLLKIAKALDMSVDELLKLPDTEGSDST